jgi:hypothetical protein
MTKISIKMIVCLLIISILTLTAGAVYQTPNMTENQTGTSKNITQIPTTVPVNTVMPANTAVSTDTAVPIGTVMPTNNAAPSNTAVSADTMVPVSEDTTQNVNQTVIQDVNQSNNQNININQNITVSTPVSTEEKDKATNIAINFVTINVGIDNPKIVDVTRKEKDLRVRVKDDLGEYIVIIISPKGEAKEEIPNVQRFVETNGNFVGEHVSFQFNKNNILNFALDGKLIFESINLGFTSTKIKRIGSTLRISDGKNTVIIHDNANGIITESTSDNIKAIYTVAPKISIDDTNKRVELSNNIKGSIISSDKDKIVASVVGNVISIKIDHGKTTFTAKVPGKSSKQEDEFEGRIVEGIDNKRIGTIINIDTEDSHDITGFDVDTTINKVVRNTVSLSVSSDVTDGRTVILRAGRNILADLNLRILADGHEVKQAKDLDDLFKNDKLAYLVVIGQNVEVLISIPKFSEHEIIVTSEPATAVTTSTTVAIPVGNTVTPDTVADNTPVPVQTQKKAPGFTLSVLLVATTVLYLMFRRNR